MDQSNLNSSSQFSQPVRQIISLLIVAGLSGLGVIIAAPSVWPVFASNIYLNGVIHNIRFQTDLLQYLLTIILDFYLTSQSMITLLL